jgi:hypothetical protein
MSENKQIFNGDIHLNSLVLACTDLYRRRRQLARKRPLFMPFEGNIGCFSTTLSRQMPFLDQVWPGCVNFAQRPACFYILKA